jgi:hypothetical protein
MFFHRVINFYSFWMQPVSVSHAIWNTILFAIVNQLLLHWRACHLRRKRTFYIRNSQWLSLPNSNLFLGTRILSAMPWVLFALQSWRLPRSYPAKTSTSRSYLSRRYIKFQSDLFAGYYKTEEDKCKQCGSYCKSCQSELLCKECRPSFNLTKGSCFCSPEAFLMADSNG